MTPHRFNLILITTAIANFACGELFLKMPLTINPIVQDAITVRSDIVTQFFGQDPVLFSRLTPADVVTNLNNSLSFVMRKNIIGAVVLGVAAKLAGLQVEDLRYQSDNKWTVKVSLTQIQEVLTEDERYVLPLSDNITLGALQQLGLRALQRRFNVSLGKISESLYSSKAMTFQSIQEDWIQVVKFITETNVNRLAAKYQVSVSTLAQAAKVNSSELYGMTLDQLDMFLSRRFMFLKGSLKIVLPVVTSSSITKIQNTLDNLKTRTPDLTSKEKKSATTFPPTELGTTRTQSTSIRETFSTTYPTTLGRSNPSSIISTTVQSNLQTLVATTIVRSQWTDRTISFSFPTQGSRIDLAISSKGNSAEILTTSAVVDLPVEGTPVREKDAKKLALFVGVPAALLILLVASSTVWCFKRKRRYSGDSKNKNNNNNIKMNNFWIEKNDSELPTRQGEPEQEEQVQFMRSPGGYAGFDSRFKGLKYVPTSSTFTLDTTLKVTKLKSDFENDSRQGIFV